MGSVEHDSDGLGNWLAHYTTASTAFEHILPSGQLRMSPYRPASLAQRPSLVLELIVNGDSRRLTVEPDTPLLLVLRNDLGLTGAKPGCGLEQCNACAVIVDGRAVPSCAVGVDAFVGRPIRTVEGLGDPGALHPVQQAFIDEEAAQCGYCIPGVIIGATALLERTPDPTDAEIRAALAPHLCRCGSHARIRTHGGRPRLRAHSPRSTITTSPPASNCAAPPSRSRGAATTAS
jgi:nicotinate dehydrogenase subunit A